MRPALEAQTRPHRSHVNPERFAGVGGAAGAGVGADGTGWAGATKDGTGVVGGAVWAGSSF